MKKLFAMILLLVLGLSHADVILDDYHSVNHTLSINNLNDYSDYAFFLVVTDTSGNITVTRIDTADIPDWYKFSSAVIYAVKESDLKYRSSDNDMLLPLTLDDLKNSNATVVNGSFSRISSLPNNSTVTHIETKYDLKLVNGTFSLEKASETSGPLGDGEILPGLPSNYYLIIPILGVLLLAGYFLLRKR